MAKKKTTKKKTSSSKPASKKKKAAKKVTRKKTVVKKKAAPKKKAAAKPAPKKKAAASKKKAAAAPRKRPSSRASSAAAAAAVAAVNNHLNGNGNGNGNADEYIPKLSEAQLRRVKTGLKKKDYDYFRQLLLEKRTEIIGDVISMESSNSGGAGNLSHMPLHMADVGSDNYEQEFTLGLVESERKLLNEIDNALVRISQKTYGVCIQSGVPIPKERLEIKPWAKYTIEVVRERERRGLTS